MGRLRILDTKAAAAGGKNGAPEDAAAAAVGAAPVASAPDDSGSTAADNFRRLESRRKRRSKSKSMLKPATPPTTLPATAPGDMASLLEDITMAPAPVAEGAGVVATSVPATPPACPVVMAEVIASVDETCWVMLGANDVDAIDESIDMADNITGNKEVVEAAVVDAIDKLEVDSEVDADDVCVGASRLPALVVSTRPRGVVVVPAGVIVITLEDVVKPRPRVVVVVAVGVIVIALEDVVTAEKTISDGPETEVTAMEELVVTGTLCEAVPELDPTASEETATAESTSVDVPETE